MSYRQMLTRKDYDFFECSSAFQKSVRRGDEKKALFFAHELYCSGYAKYVWKRILVMTTEDIGLANPNLATQINSLHDMWIKLSPKCLEESAMNMIQAVLLLARSEKSRIIDEYKIFLFKTDYAPAIPDYALDVHTRKGKIQGRGLKFFLEHGSKIENEKDTETPKEIKDFYTTYLNDYDTKKVTIVGYDKRNVTHKNPKEMDLWKKENNQKELF